MPMNEHDEFTESPFIYQLQFDETQIAKVRAEGNLTAVDEMRAANLRVGKQGEFTCSSGWVTDVIANWAEEEAGKARLSHQPLAQNAFEAIVLERRREAGRATAYAMKAIPKSIEILERLIEESSGSE